MLTFQKFTTESSGLKTAATLALAAKIAQLNRDVMQDRAATKVDKAISTQLFCLGSLIALGLFNRE
jgi:hypothetical protein